MSLPQLFGIIPTGSSVITTPTSAPSSTSLLYTLPPRPFSHIAVFLLPGITLPSETAAAVYLAFPTPPPPNTSQGTPAPNFKFLGGIGPGKESAIFKVIGNSSDTASGSNANPNGEVDMDALEDSSSSAPNSSLPLILGISIESSSSVAAQMAALAAKPPIPIINEPTNTSTSLIVAGSGKPDTLLLAQRIIKNAFNFLASWSDGDGKVPLKAFESWWGKFEGRLRSDPSFLERDGD